MKDIITAIISILMILPAIASNRYERYEVFVHPQNGDWNLPTGKNATFVVSVLHDNIPLEEGEISFEISEDMMEPMTKGTARIKNGRTVIKVGTMDKPGFLRCSVSYKGDGYEYSSSGTVGFSPEKILPTVKMPDDFISFWDKALKDARGCGLTPRIRELPELSTDDVVVYRVSYAVGHVNSRFYGVLAMPRKVGKYPAVIFYPGAGVYPVKPAMEFAERGVISLSIGIHGIPGDLDAEVYRNLDWGALQGYQTHNMEVRDRYYYRRVIMGAVRAVDFVKELDNCNGMIATYGGSQGGFLSIATAALCPDVRFLVAHFPAMSDLTGYLHGRAGGWPHMLRDEFNKKPEIINTLSYYDTVNFARLLSVPGFYTYGYNDTTCPPTSLLSVFNTISAPKEFRIAPTTWHYTFTEQYQDSLNWVVDRLTESGED